MKLKHTFLIFFLSSLLFLNMDCNDKPDPAPEPQLPPLTHEGKNTFGCLVNGELWLPDVDSGMGVVHELVADYYNGSFNVSATFFKDIKHQSITLAIFDSFYHEGSFILNCKNPGFASYYTKYCSSKTDSFHFGEINIIFFNSNTRIVSGTFEFIAYSKDCNDTVKVTEGRFDVKY